MPLMHIYQHDKISDSIILWKSKITIAWIRDFAGPSKLHDKLDRNSSETNIDTCFFSQQISRRVTLIYYSSCTGSFCATFRSSMNFAFAAKRIQLCACFAFSGEFMRINSCLREFKTEVYERLNVRRFVSRYVRLRPFRGERRTAPRGDSTRM